MDDSKRLEMEGKWDQARGRVKEAWGVLTDDELDRTGGSRTTRRAHQGTDGRVSG